VPQALALELRGQASRDHDQVDALGQPTAPAAEPLANAPLDAIALDRASDLPADHEAESRALTGSRDLDRDGLRARAVPEPSRSPILARIPNTIRSTKTLRASFGSLRRSDHAGPRTTGRRARLLRADRRNEPLSPLRAAPLQNDLTTLGAHAGTKAMGSLAANAARLEGALHGENPDAAKKSAEKRRGKLPSCARQCQDNRWRAHKTDCRQNKGDKVRTWVMGPILRRNTALARAANLVRLRTHAGLLSVCRASLLHLQDID
jgi:hypothetical protein